MPKRSLPAPLAQAAREFETWRQTRTTRNIPAELWALAVELACEFGVHRSARALRVNYANLKRRVEAAREKRSQDASGDRPVFVEVAQAPAHAECSLELESERGVKLRLELRGVHAHDVAKVATALWSGRA